MLCRPLWLPIVLACIAVSFPAIAQRDGIPTTRLLSAPTLAVPGRVDSSVPMLWTRVDGLQTLVAFASWGGIPARMSGPDLDRLQPAGDVTLTPHPGDGIWFESVIADELDEAWYAFYHHEQPAHACGRLDRSIPRIGMARSADRGLTWDNLGIVLEAPPDSSACASPNRYVIGGVGDVNVMLDRDARDLYFYYSSYSRDPRAQGIAVARLAWADRDDPQGRLAIWQDGVWLPPTQAADGWSYPAGTPLVRPTSPWHDGSPTVNADWGPSIHWNSSLNRYVMLLQRARDESFGTEGIYVSFAAGLDDPRAWSAPSKIQNGGGWYPQVAGLEPGSGTDKHMGRRGRFFLTGRSTRFIEFAAQ